MKIILEAICVGLPRDLRDAAGEWRSAIYKEPVRGPIALGTRGLAGDGVADERNHGSLDQAVCCLPGVHHDYWGERLGRVLGAGAFGENWVLAGLDELTACIGDVYALGSARVQVSQPRVPCWKQGRKLGVPGLDREIIAVRRTGFYVRVLAPGVVTAGDELRLIERPHPAYTVARVNEGQHGRWARAGEWAELAALPALSAGWRARFARRAEKGS